jgi:hypothetical protein
MKKILLAGLAAGSLLTAFSMPAHAADPEGRKCGFNSTTDVTTEAGKQAAVVQAGALYTGEAGTLYCTIIVNANTHATVGKTVSGDAVNGVVVIPPTQVQYNATAADTVALCTKWVGASGTKYWVSANPPNLGRWSTNPSDTCGEALTIAPNYPTCPIWKAIDNRLGTPLADTWQDCEPYDPII